MISNITITAVAISYIAIASVTISNIAIADIMISIVIIASVTVSNIIVPRISNSIVVIANVIVTNIIVTNIIIANVIVAAVPVPNIIIATVLVSNVVPSRVTRALVASSIHDCDGAVFPHTDLRNELQRKKSMIKEIKKSGEGSGLNTTCRRRLRRKTGNNRKMNAAE